MKDLMAYKSNLGLFIRTGYTGYTSGFASAMGSLDRWKVNGVLLREAMQPTHHKDWALLPGVDEITSVEDLKRGSTEVVGYTLKIPTLANDEIPLNLTKEEVEPFWDDEFDETRWKKYEDYRALYKQVTQVLPDTWESVPFEVKYLRTLQIDSLESPADMKINVLKAGTWGGNEKQDNLDLSSIVCYTDLERMLTPEFLLHERPCQLTSTQVYEIVRRHIKDNINSASARITSDYNFCFGVSRKVAIKPFSKQVDVRKSPRARPKFVTQTTTHKEIPCFEMTHSGENYKGYTPIAGWQANNLKEMAEQVKSYLDELMAEINRPVKECEHCGGTGHVGLEPVNTNERNL